MANCKPYSPMDAGLKAPSKGMMRCLENTTTKRGKYNNYSVYTDWQVCGSEEWSDQGRQAFLQLLSDP